MVFNSKDVVAELLPFLRVYKDGTVERFLDSPYVPPSPNDPTTGVSSKDVIISPDISARIYLPKLSSTNQKLPTLLYFHGGGFCIESAFSTLCHRYINALVSQAKILVVSVEYRLAPEHPLPTAYEDCWVALQWVLSHSIVEENTNEEPWFICHSDFSRVYLGGDSAGANIAHNLALRAGIESLCGGIKIYGVFLSHPYFLGSKPIGSEPSVDHNESLLSQTWVLVYPSALGGIDNPIINPFAKTAPSLSGLGCSRLLVCVASEDELRERGVNYCDAVRESGWKGVVELFEVEGEGHSFHIFKPETENANRMINRLASFLH